MGLCYRHIGEIQDLRPGGDGGCILCIPRRWIVAGWLHHYAREQNALEAEEGDYHVWDWRSFKLPRVARSSLSAEAQAAGQASDALELCCRFWEHLIKPQLKLRDLLGAPSSLKPVLVTDAKALYDSYHRESVTNIRD